MNVILFQPLAINDVICDYVLNENMFVCATDYPTPDPTDQFPPEHDDDCFNTKPETTTAKSNSKRPLLLQMIIELSLYPGATRRALDCDH